MCDTRDLCSQGNKKETVYNNAKMLLLKTAIKEKLFTLILKKKTPFLQSIALRTFFKIPLKTLTLYSSMHMDSSPYCSRWLLFYNGKIYIQPQQFYKEECSIAVYFL